jgi:peptidyl-prolyl cis-trans isomerase A (cyclophilin A)
MTQHTAVATIKTNHGAIKINLFGKHAPVTVKNFIDLAEKDFYNGVIFHRIIDGFMIQGGDPTGTGMGGPGYNFDDEPHDELHYDQPYKLAMANAGIRGGAGTNGSQFFITVVPTEFLWGKHTIFGEVADEASKQVVDAIAKVDTDRNDRPLDDVVMESVTIETV